MKILAITDGGNWCLDHLTDVVVQNNPQFKWEVLKVHPKSVVEHLPEIERAIKDADLIWHQYFRTAAQIYQMLPDLVKQKKHIVTQHNQKDEVFKHDQSFVTAFVVHTEAMLTKVAKHYPKTPCHIIRHGIDLDEFAYDVVRPLNEEQAKARPDTFTVGYVGRTKPWKRLVNIVEAVKQIPGTKLIGMGRRDDGYANNVDWSNPQIEWNENVPDAMRRDIYTKMDCFVQYSEDGIEEGPMPMLEAMACGIPLITSPVGEAADVIKHNINGLVVKNDDELKAAIETLKADPELRERLRANAWETIKGFSDVEMAWRYQKLFWKVTRGIDLVSVIIPTFKRPDILEKILKALEEQSYQTLEVIIVDDDPDHSAEDYLERWRKQFDLPIKYLATNNPGYGLAQARNMGAIAAVGQFLMFLDDRYAPEQDVVVNFLRNFTAVRDARDDRPYWFFGDKGPAKTEFVENFSMIKRQEFFNLGMFNERITGYGGMSQEIRNRALKAGFNLVYAPNCKAETLVTTRRKAGRRASIWRMKLLLKFIGL